MTHVNNLLFLSHRIPFPPDKGDKIRSYHILRHLASRFKIHLGCFFNSPDDARHAEQLRGLCADVYCLPLRRSQKALRAARGLCQGLSISEACYRDARMRAWAAQAVHRHDIDDIFVFCSAMFPYVREWVAGKRIVVDLVDVDSEKWRAYARSAIWPLGWIYRYEQHKLLSLEEEAASRSENALLVSQAEKETFAALAPQCASRVTVVENGVDLDHFDPGLAFPNPYPVGISPIAFTGAMNYRPNADAVTWFARDVLPAIRAVHAGAEFWIVGANPTASVRRLASSPGVRVTGAVSDTRPYLAHAACAVAPLRIARGVQNKVLEAMAMARPAVVTTSALEGLRAVSGQELLVAELRRRICRCGIRRP